MLTNVDLSTYNERQIESMDDFAFPQSAEQLIDIGVYELGKRTKPVSGR